MCLLLSLPKSLVTVLLRPVLLPPPAAHVACFPSHHVTYICYVMLILSCCWCCVSLTGVLQVSAKTGLGLPSVLPAVVE
jgi:hypothetical protein